VCLHNTLIITNFDILKYIKKIFKIPTQCTFNAQQRTISKKLDFTLCKKDSDHNDGSDQFGKYKETIVSINLLLWILRK